jgi:hypothetical protein
MFGKKRPKSFDFDFLKKRKEMKEDPHLVANGRRRRRFVCSKANGRRKRRFLCLEANGRRRRRFFFTSSHFPPSNFIQTFVFFF